MKALVIGASGGIGNALAEALTARGDDVTRLSRRSNPPLDLEDDGSIECAASELADRGPFDMILIATGLLHDEEIEPERSFRAIRGSAMDRSFRVNATGPALVMRHFLPLLRSDGRAVMAALSARVGSIGDNRIGGWVSYRASKAALNQIVQTLSIELARTRPGTILVGLHPGTVDTAMSAPFQANVKPGQLRSPADSARHLLDVLHALRLGDSGGCFDWKGERIVP